MLADGDESLPTSACFFCEVARGTDALSRREDARGRPLSTRSPPATSPAPSARVTSRGCASSSFSLSSDLVTARTHARASVTASATHFCVTGAKGSPGSCHETRVRPSWPGERAAERMTSPPQARTGRRAGRVSEAPQVNDWATVEPDTYSHGWEAEPSDDGDGSSHKRHLRLGCSLQCWR